MKDLLEAVFDESAPSLFVALRNSEELPAKLTGTDLDVSTIPGASLDDVLNHVVEKAHHVGWVSVLTSRRPHMIGASFVRSGTESTQAAMHFDIFDGITFMCVPICEPGVLLNESEVRSGIRRLNMRGQALATLLHHVAWSGGLGKLKYRQELGQVLSDPDDSAWLRSKVNSAFGSRVTRELLEFTGPADHLATDRARRRRQVRVALIASAFRRNPMMTVRQLFGYLAGQVASFLHPPGIVSAPGDPLPGVEHLALTLELACNLSPHSFEVPHVRASHLRLRSTNGPTYEESLRAMWRRQTLLRWTLPSVFLWIHAKRNRIVLVRNMPLGFRLLLKWRTRPNGAAAG